MTEEEIPTSPCDGPLADGLKLLFCQHQWHPLPKILRANTARLIFDPCHTSAAILSGDTVAKDSDEDIISRKVRNRGFEEIYFAKIAFCAVKEAQRDFILCRVKLNTSSQNVYDPLSKDFKLTLKVGLSAVAACAMTISGILEASWTMTEILSLRQDQTTKRIDKRNGSTKEYTETRFTFQSSSLRDLYVNQSIQARQRTTRMWSRSQLVCLQSRSSSIKTIITRVVRNSTSISCFSCTCVDHRELL